MMMVKAVLNLLVVKGLIDF